MNALRARLLQSRTVVLFLVVTGMMPLFGLEHGARSAYGCNIGAFVSGVSSTSLHGWLWIIIALPGNWLGIQLRRQLGLSV